MRKKLIFKIFILLVFNANVFGQGQNCSSPPDCLQNPNLFAATGGDLNANGITMPGWYYSSGTPSVNISGAGHGGANSIWMWAGFNDRGESIYSCFNFKKNTKYQICLWVKNTNCFDAGYLVIRASNGLNQSSNSHFNAIPPNSSSSQLIDNSFKHNTNWQKLVIPFTPNDDYSQLSIYPVYTGILTNTCPNESQYEIRISKVTVLNISSYTITGSCGSDIILDKSGCGATEWFDPNSESLGTGEVVLKDVKFSMSGTYSKKIEKNGCSYTVPVEVIIEDCGCESIQLDFDAGNISLDPDIYYPGIFSEISSGPGSTVSWYWDFGDGNTSNEETPQHTYPYSNATYTVCLTIIREINGQTCCKKICKEVTVNVGEGEGELIAPETPSIGFKEDQMESYPNAIHFTNVVNTTNIFREYYWDFGDGTSSRSPNPNHIYKKEGSYEVCLRIKDTNHQYGKGKLDYTTNKHCRKIKVKTKAKK